MAETSTPRIELLGVSKTFPGVRALEKVDLRLNAGEVHALLGENGAGKSTLIKIMTGALRPRRGRDPPRRPPGGDQHHRRGSGARHQHRLSGSQSDPDPDGHQEPDAASARPRRFGLISWRRARALARQRLKRLNLDIDVERPLGSYSVAIQQLVAIARALEDDTRVLVLDEPTASLDSNETELLFQIVRDLKAHGIAIVFITHFIDQVYEIADRISVLRNGRLVGEALTAELPRLKLISMMLGRELGHVEEQRAKRAAEAAGEPVLDGGRAGAPANDGAFRPLSARRRGRRVGGTARIRAHGNRQADVRGDPPELRTTEAGGRPISHNSPRHSLHNGVAFCPEDRKAEGLIGELSVRENIMLALQTKRGWLHRLSQDEQRRLAEEMIKALDIATPDADKPVGQLSGGNQQKVVLARSLASQPKVLLLDEPTRGIDVGAHAEIVSLIRKLCAEGLALLVASSELEELVAVSDRVAVLRDRKKVGRWPATTSPARTSFRRLPADDDRSRPRR